MTSEERLKQKTYWSWAAKECTVEAMMLDSRAKAIDAAERPEVLGMLGSIQDMRALELGAGIGRFTGTLAAEAKSIIALDFMENLIEENRRVHGHMGNIDFRAGDALELRLPAGSLDVVFTNWLLMYLADQEVSDLAGNTLDWLVEGGTLFFRESCFRQSGDKQRMSNPTHYRNPKEYFALMDALEHRQADGRYAHWELVSCKCVDTYVRVKKNQNQICWKWQKVCTAEPRGESFRAFLDTQQYALSGILRYEHVFGEGFVSTGGLETTKDFVSMLGLTPGQRVLDVGCGIGGGAFHMAAQHDVYVHGIDLSVNAVLLALDRAATVHNDSKVSFEIADCMTVDYPSSTFDVIYSRDTILHISDKPALFQRFFRWLKPGGRVLISDYCRSPVRPSPAFAAYIKQRGYNLHSVADYGGLLTAAGFEGVQAEDRTWQFAESLRRELATIQAGQDSFIQKFSESDYEEVVTGWQDKLVRVKAGEQRWGLFQAVKPTNA